MSKEQLKPSQQEVELDTDGVEAKEVSYEVKEPEKKLTLPNDEVIPEGTAVNEHKDDKIEVVEAKEEPKEDKPEEKENLQDYGKKVQGRINDLTKNWRESQRREKAAMQYAKGLQKQMDDMQKRFPKLEENYLTEFEARIKSDEADATRELQSAIEAQDATAIAKANQKLVTANIEKERLANTKFMREQEAEKQKEAPATQQPEIQASPKSKEWAEKNKEWFLQDQVMTSAAFEIDKQIKAEGIAGDSDQYYNELDNRIREYFPTRFSDPQEAKPAEDVKQEQKKPVQTVAPAVRNQNGRRTVKLTKSQLVISKRLGVPPEEYAKYVK
jgi:hypothetical protein